MAWHLAPSLKQLFAEVNAKWPNRKKDWDGTIGDARHSARASDHNPNSRGSVNAIDVTRAGIDTGTLIATAKKHPSVRYIIFNRKIMNRDIGNWAARPYHGANPHDHHVHISIYQSQAAENRTQSWGLANAKTTTGASGGSSSTYKPVKYGQPLKLYTFGSPVREWQAKALGYSNPDGYFGPGTEKDTKALQARFGVKPDGVVGPATWPLRNKVKQKAKRTPILKVDGKLGPATVRELQRVLKVTVDGKLGPATAKALQRNLKVRADGKIGPATVKALQRRLNVTADGKLGPNTVTALQKRLNERKL